MQIFPPAHRHGWTSRPHGIAEARVVVARAFTTCPKRENTEMAGNRNSGAGDDAAADKAGKGSGCRISMSRIPFRSVRW